MKNEKENAPETGVKENDEKNNEVQSKKEDELIGTNISELRKLKVKVDGLIFITKNTGKDSFEKINAVSHMYLLKGWFEDVLVYLGEKALNETIDLHTFHDISDEADISEGLKVQINKTEGKKITTTDANEIESINHVRRDLLNVENVVNNLETVTETAYETFIFQHLRETKFWLDRELFRIKRVAKESIFAKTEQGKRRLPKRPAKQKPLFSNINRSGGNKPESRPSMSIQKEEVPIKNKDDDKEQAETNS